MSAKYTSQWTQRAKLSPLGTDMSNDIIAAVKSKRITKENLTERKMIGQFTVLVAMWGKAMENGLREGMDSLAEEILYNQATKIRRYRGNAYPLSEKQIAVIWNHIADWASH